MRISDWSSDVCSSDLPPPARSPRPCSHARELWQSVPAGPPHRRPPAYGATAGPGQGYGSPQPSRSEEHTSELQSLMRISYAVFCLKKKKKTIRQKREIINIYTSIKRASRQIVTNVTEKTTHSTSYIKAR